MESIAIGSFYTFSLISPWSRQMTVEVVGLTSEESSNTMTDKSLYEEYFKGQSMTTYLSLVNTKTVIYMCTEVKTTDPIKMGAKPFSLPASLIDMRTVKPLIKAEHISTKINGLNEHFELAYERGSFLRDSIASLRKTVNGDTYYGALPLEISSATAEFLQPKVDFDEVKAIQAAAHDKWKEAARLNRIEDERLDNAVYAKGLELSEKIDDFDRRIVDLEFQRVNLADSIAAYDVNTLLLETAKLDMNQLFNDLDTATYVIGSAEYEEKKEAIMRVLFPGNYEE